MRQNHKRGRSVRFVGEYSGEREKSNRNRRYAHAQLFHNQALRMGVYMETAIKVKSVYKKYGKNTVLNDINLEIGKGEFVCLLGPSGCGKSTLLRLIAGLDKPTSGEIFLNGRDATYMPPAKRNFGIMFQSYALFPNLTAFNNVAYGLKNRKMTREQIISTCQRYFEMVGLADKTDRYPAQLSGGEQQRVALARALATNPSFLLLDEPLSALDAKVRIKLRKEICRIQRELGLTTIMVTHDQDEALTMADRIIVMNKALIMQSGTPQEIYENPQSKFVADFIGAINFFGDLGGKEKTCAIRPENIVLSAQRSDKSYLSTITGLEFRGNFCRISCKLTNIFHGEELIADLPYSLVKSMELSVGAKIYVSFPDSHVLNFAN